MKINYSMRTTFNIYDVKNSKYLKTDCILESVIEAGRALTDDEVRKYFGIDEDNKYWEFNHKPFRVKRYVFDKCVIPDSPAFRIEPCYGD